MVPLKDIFIFSLRTFGVGFFIYAMSRYLPRRSGGGLAAYDFVFFWMMGGLAVAPLYDLKIRFLGHPRRNREHLLLPLSPIRACHAQPKISLMDFWTTNLCNRKGHNSF